MGHMFGRLQRYVNDVKADINREIELDELRKLQQQVQSAARDIEKSVSDATRSFDAGVRSVEADLNATVKAATSGAVTASAAAGEPDLAGSVQSSAHTTSDESRASLEPRTSVESHASDVPRASVESDVAAETPRQSSLPGFDRI